MKKLFLAIALAVSVSACSYTNVEFKGINGVSNTSFKSDNLGATVNLSIENPNNFKIKIKPSILDLSVNGIYLGKVELTQKVKLDKKTTNQLDVPVQVHLEKGILMKLMGIAMSGSNGINLNIKGDVKGSVGGFGKKEQLDFTKSVSLKELGIDLHDLKLPF